MDRKTKNKIKSEIRKEVEKEITKEVKEEIHKKLHEKIYEETLSSAMKFKKEFRNELVVAITAAFGFLVALSWRGPLQNTMDRIIEKMGLTGQAIYFEYLSALIITLFAVLVLMFVSKWKSREDSEEQI